MKNFKWYQKWSQLGPKDNIWLLVAKRCNSVAHSFFALSECQPAIYDKLHDPVSLLESESRGQACQVLRGQRLNLPVPWPKAFWKLYPHLCSLPVITGVDDNVAFRHRLSNEHSKDRLFPAGQSQIVCSLLVMTAFTLGRWQNSQLVNNHQTFSPCLLPKRF